MPVKTYLFAIFLDRLTKDGYPETFLIKKPAHVYNADTLVFKFTYIKTRNTPEPLIAAKPFGFAIGPHMKSIQMEVPFLNVETEEIET